MSSKLKPELRDIPVEKLCRGRYQPRREFDEQALDELAESIKSSGLIQPVVVRPITEVQYEIIAGERRWRAAQLAGLMSIPCLINFYSDEQAAAVTAIENVNRVDLNPIEAAQAYQRLIDEFDYLHEEVAAIIGKSRTKITNSLRLLKLDKRVQQLLIAGELSEGHGKVLAGLSDALQFELAQKVVKLSWNVRKLEQEAKQQQNKINDTQTKDADIQALESNLSHYMGCKVTIEFNEQKRRLNIDFHNLEILQGILQKLGYESE